MPLPALPHRNEPYDASMLEGASRLNSIFVPASNLLENGTFMDHQIKIHLSQIINNAFPILEAMASQLDISPTYVPEDWLLSVTDIMTNLIDKFADAKGDLEEE